MKLAIVIANPEPETAWNAFRLGTYSCKKNDQVAVFLLGKGVECEEINDKKFPVSEQMQTFVDEGGKIEACGTCLKIRHAEGSELCPISTMDDLYQMISDADKVLTF